MDTQNPSIPSVSPAAFNAGLARLGVPPVPGEQPSRWITRERPKIDRIACPWLILRFIDPQAAAVGAVAYDIPDAPVSRAAARDELHSWKPETMTGARA